MKDGRAIAVSLVATACRCPPLVHPPLPQIHSPAHFLVHEVNGQSQDSFHLEDTQDGDYKLCFTATGGW